jgi:CRISPR-associated endonuclease/helicase Cas3
MGNMSNLKANFVEFFCQGTGQAPFPFQTQFALTLPGLVNVPTGLGKTAMAIIGWLWRRFGAGDEIRQATPRRLVYCLPMRVLVEQTRENAQKWIANCRQAGLLNREVDTYILMGGEDENDWDIHPERDAILIGTQDMLLSRALNRGYAASRARWPMHFGFLHTDCLWIFDEIQLMGSGLATTAQLEAFRHHLGAKDGNGCRSVWMSATMRPEWLRTVDFREPEKLSSLGLSDEDRKNDHMKDRINAVKPLTRAAASVGDGKAVAAEVVAAHLKSGGRTLVVVNTIARACDIQREIKKRLPKSGERPVVVLIHSRFRPDDRAARVKELLAEPAGAGTIIVSTQVVEAGVDVSAKTLFTELAPWASLVQRFGRCNRRGEFNLTKDASVFWIDLPDKDAEAAAVARPYDFEPLKHMREVLKTCSDVGPAHLPIVELPFEHTHVIRRKDILDLFDTTPDLAGNDIDIDRFVREIDETDVRLFWRAWDGDEPPDDAPSPTRGELCSAPIGEFKKFVGNSRVKGKVFRRDFLEGKWIHADASRIAPGQVYMIHGDAGGYDPQRGWDLKEQKQVSPLPPSKNEPNPDAYDEDGLSHTDRWQSITEHTDDVCREIDCILDYVALPSDAAACLRDAARWHDWGKAHQIFQDAIVPDGRPSEWTESHIVAKAPGKKKRQDGTIAMAGFWRRYARKHFRHELASALAVLQSHVSLKAGDRDLVAYLIAAHHGKVRLSIRSLSDEQRPGDNRRFARGVWDGDKLLATVLGGGVTAPAIELSLEPMELGLCESPPFAGQPSWIERVLRLRDAFGPFRLAYCEAILRAADIRASRGAANSDAGTKPKVGVHA